MPRSARRWRWFGPSLALGLTSAAHAELLFNNAVKAGLDGVGLTTSQRPAGGWYSDVQQGNIVFGWSFRNSSARLADDFTVPVEGWLVREFATYGFQIAVQGLTINTGLMEICRDRWDGPVVAEGVFHRAELTDIYRTIWYDHSREYQLQKVTYRVNAKLPPGTYWARWSANGNMSVGGPFVPALTEAGTLGVPGANAMQRQVTTQIQWAPVYDGGSLVLQDLPFMIHGHKLPIKAEVGERQWPHPQLP